MVQLTIKIKKQLEFQIENSIQEELKLAFNFRERMARLCGNFLDYNRQCSERDSYLEDG